MSTSTMSNTYEFSKLEITKNKNVGKLPPNDKLVFGKMFSDHLLECDWDSEKGWGTPKIVPYKNFSIPPSCSVLHYAIECFEGMKAYKSADGKKAFLFRPYKNAKRFNDSCKRIGLPTGSEKEFVKLLAKIVQMDKHFIPQGKGYSLYLRPSAISIDPVLGVAPPNKAKFFIICSPVGPYFKSGFKPVSLLANPKFIRAFPGGTGAVKLGANYGPTIYPQRLAREQGYAQLLWILKNEKGEHDCSEVGTMNLFVYWKNEKGEKELITAPLDGTVLPGITRDSVIQMCEKEWGIKVTQKYYSIESLIKAQKEGRVLEIFGSGTAAIVCPVNKIGFKGTDYDFPTPKEGLTKKILDTLMSIQYGENNHEWCYDVEKILE